MHSPRLVFAAPSSGSGKTTITCGVLQALKNRKKNLVSFKCGPDFIDPMFQERILGIPSGTLDLFFSDEETLRRLYCRNARGAELSVIEGVMGFYDGLGPATEEASTYHVAKMLRAPVILIINARGQALSALAALEGFLKFRKDSGIRGVIFNQMSEPVFKALEPEVRRMGVLPIGFLPKAPELTIESRHLGLVTPDEIENLGERLQKLSALIEQTFDLDLLLHLANEAPELECPLVYGMSPMHHSPDAATLNLKAENTNEETSAIFSSDAPFPALQGKKAAGTDEISQVSGCSDTTFPAFQSGKTVNTNEFSQVSGFADTTFPASQGTKTAINVPYELCSLNSPFSAIQGVKLAVAKDEAFCFLYKDNLQLLESLGAELCFFSPLYDRALPKEAQGLLLPGGYPELYAQTLSENLSMRESIASAIRNGLPCLAECGGFLYLHRELEDMEGHFFPMAGVFDAKAFRTDRSRRFGYITLHAPADSAFFKAGETIRAHEFHYYESENSGSDLLAVKPSGTRSWSCIHTKNNLFAGFPHLFYESNPKPLIRFLTVCAGKNPPCPDSTVHSWY